MVGQPSKSPPPPYVSWRTFWTFIEELRAKGDVPHQVDIAVLGTHRSGLARSMITTTLRFLGLIDEDRNAGPRLDDLVHSPGPGDVLRGVLEDRYAQVIALGLDRATTKQVDAVLVE